MHGLGLDLFVEVSFIKPLHEGVDSLIWILKAAYEKLPFPNSGFLDWGVALNIGDGKVSIKYFIKALFSQG